MSNTEVATEVISATSGSLIFNNSVLLNRGSGRIRVTTAGGTARFNGATMPSLQVNAGSGTNAEFFTAASTNIYFNRGIENNNATLTFGNNSNAYITGNANVTPNALIRFANLNINSGATLNLLGNIDVTNNWINNGGTFTANTSTVVFNGTVPQTIQETNSFFILTASTAGNTINCNTNLTITNTLNITGHNFNMNGNTLTLGNAAPSTLNHSGSRIVYNGTFRRWWPASATISPSASQFYGLFPVGVSGNYRPVRITSTTAPSSAGYISVTHNDPQNVFDLVPNFNDGGNLIQRVSGQNATIQLSGISGGVYNIQVQYGGFTSPGGANISHYRMITYTGSTPGAVGTHVATAGTIAAPLGARNGLTSAQLNNVFVIGTTNANATPILRIYYARKNGTWSDGASNATWSTIAPGGASCNCTPPANSVVEISNGYVVDLDVNATVNDIKINNAQLIGTGNLTVNNDFIVSGSGSFNPTAGNYTIGNDLKINGTGTSNFSSGNNQILGNLENYATLNFGSSTLPLQVRGNWLNNGTFNPANGTVLLNGSIGQSITGNTNFNNLTVNNSTGVSIVGSSYVNIINTLTIQAGTFNTSGNLTLLSTPTGTARLAPLTGSSDIIGDIIMQRYVYDSGVSGPLGKWREISAPVIGATFADWQDDFTTWGLAGSNGFSINNFISIYQYDESVPDVNDSGYVSPTDINEEIEHPIGYWAYIDNTPLTIDVKGAPGKGTVNFDVTYTPSSAGVDHDGWNLVANPYPSPINWDATGWTKVNIEDAIYVWNPTLQQYASYAGGVGVNGGTAHVASSQAFWVHAIGANPSLIATENVKSSVDGTFKNNNITPPRGLLLSIHGNGFSDETAIRFTNAATDSFDLAFDASKLWSFNANVPSISSLALNHDYSINTLPEFTESISIPVRVWTYVSTNFTITANLSDFPYQNACITLEDLQTGIVQDLRLDSTYSCFIPDTTDLPRFVLHISLPVEKSVQQPTCHNQSNGKIIAKGSGAGPWSYTWKDLNGQVLRTTNNVQTSDTLSNLAAGFYVVDVQNTLCGNFSDTIQIINPSPITVSYNITPPTCKDSEDGIIELLPAGGTEPYSIIWSDNSNSQNLNNAQAAMYQVQISDANLCTNAFSFVLNALYPVSSEFTCADTVYLQNNIANVQFTNLSVGADSFEWDFDDGEDAISTANPVYTYTSEGIYLVRLKAINQLCDDVFEKTIVVLNEVPSSVQANSQNPLAINAFTVGNKIIIAFKGVKNEDVKVALLDNLGRETIAQTNIPKNSMEFEIPYSGIATGIYYLRLNGESIGDYTIKMIIP
jgi:PKD repeat protein